MSFETADLRKDQKGRIRKIDHSAEPVVIVKNPETKTPQFLACRYVKKYLELKNIQARAFPKKIQEERRRAPNGNNELWLSGVHQTNPLSVVEYSQFQDGIPVWKSGLSVLIHTASGKIVEATSQYDHDIPPVRFEYEAWDKQTKSLDEKSLPELLAMDKNRRRLEVIKKDILQRKLPLRPEVLEATPKFKISKKRQILFPYDPHRRKHKHADNGDQRDRNLAERALDIALPDVDPGIEPGSYRAATEVFFATGAGDFQLNWHAVVDYRTNSVLYIRPLIEMLGVGFVYDHDPITTTGDASLVATAPLAALNGPRNPRSLTTTVPANLSGQYVDIQEICPIVAPPPTSPTNKFDYDADTDDFSAVNAYYHSDAVFRMVAEMGFDMATYFDGTAFPVPVDHRGSSACVNAAAWGNGGGDGLGSFTFGLVDAASNVGIANDIRVVLHEFGHAILWDNVHSPNFGFAHSCGDSLAAVLCDPNSKAPDRFLTFPWVTAIARRHDRDIAAGWAWGGVNDTGSYDSEQILSTSHFRAYRSMGGDHHDRCEREWAARYLTYLMIHAVGTLTPATNPNNSESWSDRLQLCDRITEVFEGHPGGAVHKVIRWAFEQQGAYQPPGAPTPVTAVGAPPVNDLYINDGRNGEYGFTRDWCHSKDIWNRLCPDGYPAHQAPIPGIENYAYVIVRNRGTHTVPKGTVTAYHKRDNACCDCCDDCHELTWPNDFQPMITEQRSFGPIPPGDYRIVGPFAWKPNYGDCILMVADSIRDRSNLAFIDKGQSLLTRRLVPFDNNIALRCICKQCNPDYSKLRYIKPCPKPNPIDDITG